MITDKEARIVTLLAEGNNMKMAGKLLNCSRDNIYRICTELRAKLGCANVVELISFCQYHGLITTQKHIRKTITE